MKKRRKIKFLTSKTKQKREEAAIAAFLKNVMGVQAYYAR